MRYPKLQSAVQLNSYDRKGTMTERIDQLQGWVVAQLNHIHPEASLTLPSLQRCWSVVSGDASFRRYFRVAVDFSADTSVDNTASDTTYIVMDSPAEDGSLPAFIAIAEQLRSTGLRAPIIYSSDSVNGFLLLEDFGDNLIKAKLDPQIDTGVVDTEIGQDLFDQILPVLATMAATCPTETLPEYSEQLLRDELGLFDEWYVSRHLQQTFSAQDQSLWKDLCQQLVDSARSQTQVFVHRDFHSCNLLSIAGTEDPLGIIDFQDAALGPLCYDLASWLWDRYVTWPRADLERWMLQARNVLAPADSDMAWIRQCDWIGLQRNLKVIGIFARLHYRDGKSNYLTMIPQFGRYVVQVSKLYPELQAHSEMLQRYIDIDQ